MANTLNGILGISLASIIRGLRNGWQEFRYTSHDTTALVKPFESADLASLPVLTLEQLLAGRKASIVLDVQAHVDGQLLWGELAAMLSLIVPAAPRAILEIGTFMGHTSWLLARNLPDSVIYTLDLPLDYKSSTDPVAEIPKDDFHLISNRQPGHYFAGTPEAARIHQYFGDSATWDYSQAVGATCFFIDGSHTYEYAKVDSEKCYQLCGGKGLFFWHDCDDRHPGVCRLLAEWKRAGRSIVRIRGTSVAYWNNG